VKRKKPRSGDINYAKEYIAENPNQNCAIGFPARHLTSSRMKYRKLRIAFSALWSILCVLLIALWIRSYWGYDGFSISFSPSHEFTVASGRGQIVLLDDRLSDVARYYEFVRPQLEEPRKATFFPALFRPMTFRSGDRFFSVTIEYWLVVAVAALAAGAPLFSYRFCLRTLLIATTLIGLILGSIIATTR
jgi:hypothetical protein